MSCVFCRIVERQEPASIVFEDERLLAFMDIRPVRRGQLLIIPKRHVDHFVDLADDLAAAVFERGRRLARVLYDVLTPRRVGMIVHGFGVAHAHLILLPLEHPSDITSAQCAVLEDGRVRFRPDAIPIAPREDLDALAGLLRGELGGALPTGPTA